jgi:hypothetical protein
MAVNLNRLDHLRVASPCSANWDQMSGDDRVRFCDLCNLHVYNIAQLTRKEAATLMAGTEGRLCARLFRRADGTVITKNCPVGLRAIRRHVAKVAGAVFAAVFSLCSNVFTSGRNNPGYSIRPEGSCVTNSLMPDFQASLAMVGGKIRDPNGDAIKGATITLTNEATNQKRVAKSDAKGEYRFMISEFGSYVLKVETPYYQPWQQHLALHPSDDLRLDVSLVVPGIVGIVIIEEPRGPGFDLDGVHIRINEGQS